VGNAENAELKNVLSNVTKMQPGCRMWDRNCTWVENARQENEVPEK